MTRRDFVRASLGASADLAIGRAASAQASKAAPFAGLQVQPFSFYDESIERVLDHAQLAGTNALFIYTHLFAVACREYQEMRMPNLRAVGRGVADAAKTFAK